MGLEVVPAGRGRPWRQFVALPYRLHRADPAFVPPLRLERRQHFDPRRNPFFAQAEVALLLARRGGLPVGRISVHADREEERWSGVRGATFGSFEAADGAAAAALLAAAEGWARERGRNRLRGPFTLSVNQESGLLVEGFSLPPTLLTAHNPEAYGGWVEAAGFRPARDLYGWRLQSGRVPAAFRRAGEKAAGVPDLRVRPVDLGRLEAELAAVRAVFNAAWSRNWGFVPLTDLELRAMARDLRPILDPRIALIAEAGGRAVGIAIGLPDLNRALAGLGGRLLLLGWARLLWRLKLRGVGGARLALFGVDPGHRVGSTLAVTALLLCRLCDAAAAAGYRDWEISWVLEDNSAANQGARAMGAARVKTWRLYEKTLD